MQLNIFIFTVFLCLAHSEPTKPHKWSSLDTNAIASSPLREYTEDSFQDDVLYFDEVDASDRTKKSAKVWDHWGKWSQCTVTCGIGKMTRWRHCVSEGCAPGEKEAQIKTCKKKSC